MGTSISLLDWTIDGIDELVNLLNGETYYMAALRREKKRLTRIINRYINDGNRQLCLDVTNYNIMSVEKTIIELEDLDGHIFFLQEIKGKDRKVKRFLICKAYQRRHKLLI